MFVNINHKKLRSNIMASVSQWPIKWRPRLLVKAILYGNLGQIVQYCVSTVAKQYKVESVFSRKFHGKGCKRGVLTTSSSLGNGDN